MTSSDLGHTTSTFSLDDWDARCVAHHEEEIVKGLHDDACEYGHRQQGAILRLCHCSKRRREREGFTTPPDGDLEWRAPLCSRCGEETYHDGDGFRCDDCCLSWDSNGRGSSCAFIDDYGDLTDPVPSGHQDPLATQPLQEGHNR